GQLLHLELRGVNTSPWPTIHPLDHHYITPFDGGRIVAGATREDGVGFDVRATAPERSGFSTTHCGSPRGSPRRRSSRPESECDTWRRERGRCPTRERFRARTDCGWPRGSAPVVSRWAHSSATGWPG